MEITALSGAILTQLHEEELGCMVESGQTVLDLKKLLADRLGYSRFRQRLLSEEAELRDDMPLSNLPPLQLVVLDFCTGEVAVREELLLACEQNQVGEVARLLQQPLDPNRHTGINPI